MTGLITAVLAVSALHLPADGWIHWSEPAVAGTPTLCCGTGGTCRLEDADSNAFNAADHTGKNATRIDLYLHRRAGTDAALVLATPDCAIDSGNAEVVDLDPVPAARSLAWLREIVDHAASGHVRGRAIQAIAHHALDKATPMLAALASDEKLGRDTREQAAFWLGARRGDPGIDALAPLVADGQPRWLRSSAVFAATLSKRPHGIALAKRVAVQADDAHIRAHALSSLAINQVPDIAAFLAARLRADGAHEVREQAMFGLSQLRNERHAAITALEAVVHDPAFGELRRQALFWLARMADPEANAAVEKVVDQ
ncbi:MAG: HEAT repeat domain-containing protein [Gammaproteobacteria bacterium]|jgi:hypothetical protein